MIVRMSKIEIAGPKDLLQGVLSLLRDMGIFQIEPAAIGFIEKGNEEKIRSFSLDEKSLFERLFLEDLRLKIDELFSFLPDIPVRESYIEPISIIDVIARTISRHIERAKELSGRRESLLKERSELKRYKIFLGALSPLIENTSETPNLEFIGLTIRDPGVVGHLRDAISRITDWKFELLTDTAEDGTMVGLITVEKDIAEKVKKSLSDEQVPELLLPPSFSGLTFSEKIDYVNKRDREAACEIEKLDTETESFAKRWVPIYRNVKDWITDRLSLLRTTSSAFETKMCFFVHGWMTSGDVGGLREKLAAAFGKQVVLEELEMHEEDLERVPIILKNPPYFKPFELFTRLLPLPAYTSYDPTPFIGIFFPIFFGMILGDAGYGLILGVLALFLVRRHPGKGILQDGARILAVASLYSIFFGILFGEFFGDLPHRLFGLEPLCVERRTAIVPMLFFTLAVGVAHVFLGLFLGALNALKKKEMKEAAYKVLSILVILLLIAALASSFGVFPSLLTRPIILAILFLTPFIFFTGGLLAPLELLKSIGNVISYVRIMAIGLTSVLLAFVANQLAGLSGDVVIGVMVAALLHLLNMVLGVFSPTIHSLRLHYVEFFSKFIEHGGKKFEPLKKEG